MSALNVYETSAGAFVLASERDGQYTAPFTAEARRLTGASAACGRDLDDVAASPNVRKYASAAQARQALQAHLDGDDGDEVAS